MLDILAITGPIYFTIALGFLTTRIGLFDKSDMRIFGKFVINLALPALLFNALAQRNIREILDARYVVAYLSGTLLVLGLGWFWCRRRAGLGQTGSAIYVMGMTCSNSGYVGYPILLLTLPQVAGVALALNVMMENVVVIPMLLALAEAGRGESGHWSQALSQTLRRLATNPMIIGLVAGCTVSVFNWTLPEPIARTVNLFAVSSSAISLFVIGGTLVGLEIRGMGDKVKPILLGKLIFHPLAVFLALTVLSLLGASAMDRSLRMAAVLMAAMPTMGIFPIIAQAYDQEDLSAAALMATTIASFFTLSACLWLGNHVVVWG